MADVQDDSADSRTSIVGRKRGFEEVLQDRPPIESEGSADEERLHKRTRASDFMIDSNNLQSSHTDSVSAACLAVPSEHEAKPSEASGLEVEVEELHHAVASAPMNWNKVVQSGGLRTSFASKKTRLNAISERVETAGRTASYNSPERVEASMDMEEDSSSDDDTDQDDQSNGGVPLSGNTGTAPTTDSEFKWGRKLPKSQVKQLSQADRKSYREASRAAKAVARKGLKPTPALIQAEIIVLRSIPKGKKGKKAFLRKARDQAAADIAKLKSLQSVSLLGFPFRIDSPLHILSEGQKAQLSEEQMLAYKTALALDPNQQQIWTYLQTLTSNTELPSVIPVPYADLPELYFKALNSDQLQAYARARTAYSQQLKKGSTRPKGPAIPAVKILRPTEVAALNAEERGLYENGLPLLKATDMATNFLMTLQKWPPSDQSGDVFLSMANGLTFYPRINGLEPSQLFKDTYGEFILDEVVDDDGKPIELRKFSPHIFLATFLKKNAGKLPRLAGGTVKRCFEAYITKFYSHVTQYADALRLAGRVLTNKEIKASLATAADNSHQVVNRPIEPQKANSPIQSAANDTRSASKETDVAKGNFDHSMEPISSLQLRNGSISSNGEIVDHDLNETQLLLQQKYFPIPGVAPTTITQYCLACAHKGHDSSTCPALSCTSCGAKHSIFRCPDRQRCTKCRELGHSKAECPEKLAVPKSELRCDICGSQEHIEIACHQIWRSFDPRPEEIRTVRQITISCYMCGSGSHFGPECGLYRGPLYTGGLTWSTANLQKYIDAASGNRALSAGVDYSIPSRKGFSIKGQANDPITFDDSDDGESFIRPKIQATERGHIRFNDKKESRPMAPLPRHPASPVAPYHDSFNSGYRSQENFEYGMSSEYPYSNQPPTSQQGDFAFQMRPKNEGSRNNNQPPKASKNSNQNRPKAKGGSRGGARGGRARGRGRGH
jgi:hypothetical protein